MVGQRILQLLEASTDLASVVGDRIYQHENLPEGETLPAVTFRFVSDTAHNTYQGDTGHSRERWSINIWAQSLVDADALRGYVRAAMAQSPKFTNQGAVPLHELEPGIYRFVIDYSAAS